MSWWLISVPWVSNHGWYEALRNCFLLGLLNLVYFLRARTEERHLSKDPDYVAYALWIEQHGLLRWVGQLIPFFKYKPPQQSLNPNVVDTQDRGLPSPGRAAQEAADSERMNDLSSGVMAIRPRSAEPAVGRSAWPRAWKVQDALEISERTEI